MIRQQACGFMYLQDAYLPQRLVDKLMYMYNYIEMARVTGVPMSFLLTRGQSIKVFSQILRKARQKNLLVPFLKVGLRINQQHCSHSAQPPFSKELFFAEAESSGCCHTYAAPCCFCHITMCALQQVEATAKIEHARLAATANLPCCASTQMGRPGV